MLVVTGLCNILADPPVQIIEGLLIILIPHELYRNKLANSKDALPCGETYGLQ